MKNARYHSNDVKNCCENKLSISFRKGKEFNGWFRLNDKKIARITIPKGRKPIPEKTYKSMASQLQLTINEFDQLLDCDINLQQYTSIMKEKMGD